MNKLIFTLIVIVLFPMHSFAVSFSADAVQIRNGEFSHARMFWTDKKVRFEYLEQGVPMVQIYDTLNKKVIWLDTENKVFLERNLSASDEKKKGVNKKVVIKNPCEVIKTAQCTRLKEVVVNGRKTVKWLITFIVKGSDKHVFQWLDKQYGIVIKQENSDGLFINTTITEDIEVNGRNARKVDMYAISKTGRTAQNVQWYDSELDVVVRQVFADGGTDELRNIKVEKISASLFKIPKGYEEVDQTMVSSQPEELEVVEAPSN